MKTNIDRCTRCVNNPKRQSDWFYCNNPDNFREFDIIRLYNSNPFTPWTTKPPPWCLHPDDGITRDRTGKPLHGINKMEWISIQDEYPKEYQKVLINTTDVDDNYITSIAHWNGSKTGFLVANGIKDKGVTHWQPLPDPITEGGI